MNARQPYHSIEGLSTVEPVGAVLTIGTKSPSGYPHQTDRFFIKVRQENENRIRVDHPMFRSFNEAEPGKRQAIRGNLVHATRAEAFDHLLRAQVLGKAWRQWDKAHPQGRPVCSGDGKKATRLYGIGENGAEDWREIDCPNDLCQFRQGDVKACKPFARLYFRPRWPEGVSFPTPLMKLTTTSWNSASAFVGFFDYVEDQARNLGLSTFSLYGLPFILSLHRKTKPQSKSAFPVLAITPDCDLIDFFLRQQANVRTIGGGAAVALLPASNLTPDEASDEELSADLRNVTPTSAPVGKPSNPEPSDTTDAPELLSTDALKRILDAAERAGLSREQLESMAGGRLEEAPPSAEIEILRAIQQHQKRKAR